MIDMMSHIGIFRIENRRRRDWLDDFTTGEETATLSQQQAEMSTYAMGYSDEFTQILHRPV